MEYLLLIIRRNVIIYYISENAVGGYHFIGINWRLNFADARATCEAMNATLPFDLSEEQNSFIAELLLSDCPEG